LYNLGETDRHRVCDVTVLYLDEHASFSFLVQVLPEREAYGISKISNLANVSVIVCESDTYQAQFNRLLTGSVVTAVELRSQAFEFWHRIVKIAHATVLL